MTNESQQRTVTLMGETAEVPEDERGRFVRNEQDGDDGYDSEGGEMKQEAKPKRATRREFKDKSANFTFWAIEWFAMGKWVPKTVVPSRWMREAEDNLRVEQKGCYQSSEHWTPEKFRVSLYVRGDEVKAMLDAKDAEIRRLKADSEEKDRRIQVGLDEIKRLKTTCRSSGYYGKEKAR